MRLALTLKFDKLSTPHSSTASLATGIVTFSIGPVNFGISKTKETFKILYKKNGNIEQ